MSILLRVFTAALTALLGACVWADGRQPTNPQGPFAKLTGEISSENEAEDWYGNGFVFGAQGCYVLTNFHVAFGKSGDPKAGESIVDDVAIGHTVLFSFDLDANTGYFKRTLRARVIDFGNYELGTSRGFLGDLAVLRLETCLGENYSGLEFDDPPANKRVPAGELMTIGVWISPTTRRREVLMEVGCHADSVTTVTGIFISDCTSVPGMSGSMILEKGADKRWRLAGITTGGGAKRPDGERWAKAIYVKVLNKFLKETGVQ